MYYQLKMPVWNVKQSVLINWNFAFQLANDFAIEKENK